jgi:hypothetical protein
MSKDFRRAVSAMKLGDAKTANAYLKKAKPLSPSYRRIWQRVVQTTLL